MSDCDKCKCHVNDDGSCGCPSIEDHARYVEHLMDVIKRSLGAQVQAQQALQLLDGEEEVSLVLTLRRHAERRTNEVCVGVLQDGAKESFEAYLELLVKYMRLRVDDVISKLQEEVHKAP